MTIKLSSTEAQILVDELNRAIRSTKKSNAKYALEAQELRDKILSNKIRLNNMKTSNKTIKIGSVVFAVTDEGRAFTGVIKDYFNNKTLAIVEDESGDLYKVDVETLEKAPLNNPRLNKTK